MTRKNPKFLNLLIRSVCFVPNIIGQVPPRSPLSLSSSQVTGVWMKLQKKVLLNIRVIRVLLSHLKKRYIFFFSRLALGNGNATG